MPAIRFPEIPDAEFPQTPSAELMHAASLALLRSVDASDVAKEFFGWAEALFKAIEHFAEKDKINARRLAVLGEFVHSMAEEWFSTQSGCLNEAHDTFRRLTMKDRP